MKQKRKYSEARMEVVQLSGKSQLLSGSTSVDAGAGSRSFMLGEYGKADGVFD